MAHVGVDVLDGHGRLVHQDADGQGQSAQGHQVDRLPAEPQGHHGRHQRQGDVQQDDQRAPPVAQEQQDHQPHQQGPQHPLADHAPDRSRHVGRLVELVTDVDVRRQDGLHVGQGRLDRVDHAQGRGVGPLGHEDVHAAAAVDQGIAGRDVGAVLDISHVAEIDRRSRTGRAGGCVSRSWTSRTTELTGTKGYFPSSGKLPEGLIALPWARALTTSSGRHVVGPQALRDRP